MRRLLTILCALAGLHMAAQSPCDDVELTAVHINPLNADFIGIHVENNSMELFDYPGFRVYFESELIAEEEVNFFGIGEESVHGLPQTMADIIPGEEYDLTIELWTGFYDELVCTFEVTTVLIPTVECHPISVWAFQSTEKQIMDPIIMEISDIDGNIVYSEGHEFSPDNPFFEDVVCLHPGCYTASVTTSDDVISADIQFSFYTVEAGGIVQIAAVAGDAWLSAPLNVWSNCGPTHVDDQLAEDSWNLFPNPTTAILQFSSAISGTVMNMRGQVIAEVDNKSSIDVSEWSSGMYFLVSEQGQRRFIVE
jgi:hypothetical protein